MAGPDVFQEQAPFSADKGIFGLHLRRTNSGLWYDQHLLPSPDLLAICSRLQNADVTMHLNGDGLPNSLVPASVSVYHCFSSQKLAPLQFSGQHSLLLVSSPLPFDDSPPVRSLKSWVTLFREALTTSAAGTCITVALLARQTTAALPMLPILDRRFELDRIKAWKVETAILPDMCLCERDPVSTQVARSPLPTPFPILIFAFRTPVQWGKFTAPQVIWMDPPASTATPEEAQAFHVLLNVPASTPLPNGMERPTTSNRILGMLNMMDPGETSTQLRMASHLRYPAIWPPAVQRASPDKTTVAHYLVPLKIVDHLTEDLESLQMQGIRWMILSADRPTYVINHLPHRVVGRAPSYKAQADEVLDSILCSPQVARLFDECLVLNRWDVITKVAEGVDLEVLATTLSNLDHLVLLEANSMQLIKPASECTVVQPPHLILASPPTILPDYAIQVVCKAASLLHHQAMSVPGRSLLTFEHKEVAAALAGARIPCGSAGFLTLTTGSAAQDQALSSTSGIPLAASWDQRLANLPPLPRLTLSAENVAAAAAADPMQEN